MYPKAQELLTPLLFKQKLILFNHSAKFFKIEEDTVRTIFLVINSLLPQSTLQTVT